MSDMDMIVSPDRILKAERTRLSLIQEVRNKGIEISNNEQIGNIPQKIKSIEAPTSIFDKTIKSIESMVSQPIEAYAFNGCSLLEKAYFPNATKVGSYAFQNTALLNNKNGYFPFVTSVETYSFYYSGFENIILSALNFNIPPIGANSTFVQGSSRLKRLIAPFGKFSYGGQFNIGLNAIETIDIYKIPISTTVLKNTVKVLILRDDSAISSATNNIATAGANATIYVPQALLNNYKTASNWSMIADQIVALEGTKYEPIDWWKTEDWFLNMYHYTSVLEEEETTNEEV